MKRAVFLFETKTARKFKLSNNLATKKISKKLTVHAKNVSHFLLLFMLTRG